MGVIDEGNWQSEFAFERPSGQDLAPHMRRAACNPALLPTCAPTALQSPAQKGEVGRAGALQSGSDGTPEVGDRRPHGP